MKIHPNQDSLGRLMARVGTGQGRRVLGHLLDCDRCRVLLRQMLEWSRENPEDALPWTPKDYAALLDRLVEQSETLGTPLTHEQVEAPVLLAELLLHPTERRRLLLRNSARFRSWALAELFLDRSREESFEDPAQAEILARLGLEVVSHLEAAHHPPKLTADLEARGHAYLANSLRMQSDLAAADQEMNAALEALKRGTGDPCEAARVLDLQASLRRDQRRFEEAVMLLRTAIQRYRSIGERHRAARARLNLAITRRDSGNPQLALAVMERALEEIDIQREPRLALCAQHNMAVWLTDLDRFMEARKVFGAVQSLYDRFPDPWTQRRRAWLEGRILQGLGQWEAAEARLEVAQRGFLEQEIAYDAALVSLDLAAVYAHQERTGDLTRLAEGMLPIFRARDIHREALTALSYFRYAAELERASAPLVRGLLDYLHRARYAPDLRFTVPDGT